MLVVHYTYHQPGTTRLEPLTKRVKLISGDDISDDGTGDGGIGVDKK